MKLMKNLCLLALVTALGSGVAYADETQEPTPEVPAMASNKSSLASGQDSHSLLQAMKGKGKNRSLLVMLTNRKTRGNFLRKVSGR